MSYSRPASLFGRLNSLLRGVFGFWIRNHEHGNPEIVYEQAIAERVRQYRELKSAVAGILYLRTKLEAEISERRADIARMHDDVRRAVRGGRDEISLSLIGQKQVLFEELERAEDDLQRTRMEAEEAKANLMRFRDEIRSLVREKGRMLATLANAQARRRLQVAIEGLSVDAEMDALENVREHIGRIAVEGHVDTELGDAGLRSRLREFRDEGRHEAARSELESLKQEMTNNVIAASALPRVEERPAVIAAR